MLGIPLDAQPATNTDAATTPLSTLIAPLHAIIEYMRTSHIRGSHIAEGLVLGASSMPKSVFSDAYAIFLRALVAARKDAGVSQVELARRVGRDQPFISLVENGVRRVDLIEFYVLAWGIGVDPVALFAAIASELPDGIEI